jgi:hypothetical protein
MTASLLQRSIAHSFAGRVVEKLRQRTVTKILPDPGFRVMQQQTQKNHTAGVTALFSRRKLSCRSAGFLGSPINVCAALLTTSMVDCVVSADAFHTARQS